MWSLFLRAPRSPENPSTRRVRLARARVCRGSPVTCRRWSLPATVSRADGLPPRHKDTRNNNRSSCLCVFVTSWSTRRAVSLVQICPDDRALVFDQLLYAFICEPHERVEGAAIEWESLRCALELDEAAVAGLHEVHVHFRLRVLFVGEVEQRRAADDADAGGGDVIDDR